MGRTGGTREFLLETARSVMIERGLGRATMREIADRAGVNPALLHYYFGTKIGLFTSIVESVREQLSTQLDEIVVEGVSASERLRLLMKTYARVISDEPYIARLMLEELLAEPNGRDHYTDGIGELLAVHVRRLFDDGLRAGEFRRPRLPFPFTEIAPRVVLFLLMAPLGVSQPETLRHLEAWSVEASTILLEGLRPRT